MYSFKHSPSNSDSQLGLIVVFEATFNWKFQICQEQAVSYLISFEIPLVT